MRLAGPLHRSWRAALVALLALTWPWASVAKAEPAEFRLDPEQTSITFFVHHLGFAEVAGMFLETEGSFRYDEEARQLSDLRIVVHTASVFTHSERRDGHLRSDNFLDVENYPEMIFVGRRAEPLSDDTGKIYGELTIRDVTRPLVLDVRLNKSGRWPFLDEHYAIGIDATATLRRSDYGMTYGVENGWVGDEVRIVIGSQAIRQE
jgi:polyisoprenoid-binding protein YceI